MAARARKQIAFAVLAVVAFTLPACQHATLGKPAFVGASATAGVGAATSADPEGELPVDLAVAYDAVVEVGHDDAHRCADGLFYQRPVEAAREQAAALADTEPSVVFAVDWLFWAAYAPVSDRGPTATALREGPMPALGGAGIQPSDALTQRLHRVDAALIELEALDAAQTPVVLGDIPSFAGDAATLDRPVSTLSATDVAVLNARVATWAAARPWVVVLPVSSLAAGPRTLPDGTPLMQPDGLHPTAAGLVVMMQQSMAQLESRGLVKAGQWRRDPAAAMDRLPKAAREALDAPAAGWLDKAGMYLAYRSLEEQLDAEPVDCDAAVESVGRLFGPAPTLEKDPSGMGFGVTMATWAGRAALEKCPGALVPLRRCADRLGLDIRRSHPNAFRLELWAQLSEMLGRDREVDDRLARLCRELGPAWGDLAPVINQACARLRQASGDDWASAAAARARVVAMLGGAQPTLARGQWVLEQNARTRRDHGTEPTTRSVASPVDRRNAPLPLPQIDFPPSNDARADLWMRSERARGAMAYLADLRGAAANGVADVEAASRDLLETIRASVGDDGIAVAMDRMWREQDCVFLPNGGVVMRGYVEPAQRINWGPFVGEEPLSLSFEGVVQPKQVTSQRPSPPAMQQLMDHRPAIAIGLTGRFGAPDGAFTFIDGESVVTRMDDSTVGDAGTTDGAAMALVSRPAAADDQPAVSIRPAPSEWVERPLGGVADLPGLWAVVWREAQLAGVDIAFPFGVRIDGSFESITVRVERGAESAPSPTEATSSMALLFGAPLPITRTPTLVDLRDVDASLVGVVAPWSICRAVRPDTPMTLHAVWVDAGGTKHTAEVVGVRGGTGLSARLPG